MSYIKTLTFIVVPIVIIIMGMYFALVSHQYIPICADEYPFGKILNVFLMENPFDHYNPWCEVMDRPMSDEGIKEIITKIKSDGIMRTEGKINKWYMRAEDHSDADHISCVFNNRRSILNNRNCYWTMKFYFNKGAFNSEVFEYENAKVACIFLYDHNGKYVKRL